MRYLLSPPSRAFIASYSSAAKRQVLVAGAAIMLGTTLLASGARGQVPSPTPAIPGLRPPHVAVSYALGWNLVAGPEGSHVRGAIGSLYTLQSGATAYEAVPVDAALQACRGYWAYFPTGGNLEPALGPYTGCTVHAVAGEYVMAGNPSAQYEAQSFNSDPDSTWLYSPATGYHLALTTIPVGQGAWVISAGSGAANGIQIQPVPSGSPSVPAVEP